MNTVEGSTGMSSSVGVGIAAPSSPGTGMGVESFSSLGSFSSFESSLDLNGGMSHLGIDSFNSIPFASEYLSPISLDTSFNSYERSLFPSVVDSLVGINLNPDVADVAEIVEITKVPQSEFLDPPSYSEHIHAVPDVFQNAFKDNFVEEIYLQTDNLESVLEPISESIDIVDIPIAEPQSIDIEQIIYQSEPEIDQIEANTFVIPSEVETSTECGNLPNLWKIAASSATEVGTPRNDNIELAALVETPAALTEVITTEQLAMPELTQIIQTNPETIQATKTYQAFVDAGVDEVQAIRFIEETLTKTGIEPEVVQQMMIEVQTKQQVKAEVKPTQAVKVESKIEKIVEEEEKKKKKRLKFIIDKNALASIFIAWKKAVESAPVKIELGEDVIDSSDALALMPTEVQNSGVISGILPKYILEWLNFGDGAYRTALSMAKDIGLRSKQAVLERVFALHQKYYPVTVAENGEEAAQANVDLVLTHKSDPVRN